MKRHLYTPSPHHRSFFTEYSTILFNSISLLRSRYIGTFSCIHCCASCMYCKYLRCIGCLTLRIFIEITRFAVNNDNAYEALIQIILFEFSDGKCKNKIKNLHNCLYVNVTLYYIVYNNSV